MTISSKAIIITADWQVVRRRVEICMSGFSRVGFRGGGFRRSVDKDEDTG